MAAAEALQAAVKSDAFVVLAQMAAGAAGGARATVAVTTCVATPAVLLAVKVNVCVPTSLVGGW